MRKPSTLVRQVVDAGPPTKERVWDYTYMLYAMGHLEEVTALVEQVRANEPMALYLSRDLQYDYTATRRYEDAEAEYRRARVLEGSQLSPDSLAFFRQLAGKRAGGMEELRALHARLLRQSPEFDTPFFRELGAVLGDREAMLARVRKALEDESYGGGSSAAYLWTNVADALGDADLAVAAMRRDPGGLGRIRAGGHGAAAVCRALERAVLERARASGLQEAAGRNRRGRLLAPDRPLGRRLRAGGC